MTFLTGRFLSESIVNAGLNFLSLSFYPFPSSEQSGCMYPFPAT